MKVLKFGGGCLKDAKSIKKVPKIISHYDDDIVIVILSAFGKITNMLEDEKHENMLSFIQTIMMDLSFSLNDIEDILKKKKYFNFSNRLSYPERVSIGEYLSSEIIHRYLKLENIENIQLDAAKYIFTDSWAPDVKSAKFHSIHIPNNFLESIVQKTIITQGFIASDINSNLKTTLGREGSDYSAAIFGAAFNADEVMLNFLIPIIKS